MTGERSRVIKILLKKGDSNFTLLVEYVKHYNNNNNNKKYIYIYIYVFLDGEQKSSLEVELNGKFNIAAHGCIGSIILASTGPMGGVEREASYFRVRSYVVYMCVCVPNIQSGEYAEDFTKSI